MMTVFKKDSDGRPRRPILVLTIVKILFGLIFVAASFNEGQGVGYVIFCLSIAAALIAWGVIPWLRYRKEEKLWQEEKDRQRAEEVRLREEEKKVRENRVYVCPGCGATSKGKVCEYCGTKLG